MNSDNNFYLFSQTERILTLEYQLAGLKKSRY